MGWFTCDQMLRECQTFARFTPQLIESKLLYFHWLCENLDFRFGITKRPRSGTRRWSCRDEKGFRTLRTDTAVRVQCSRKHAPNAPRICQFSLDLIYFTTSIFPVTTSDGSQTIRTLSGSLFVPDSELLPHFTRTVDILDFGRNYIWDILPLLRCSTA